MSVQSVTLLENEIFLLHEDLIGRLMNRANDCGSVLCDVVDGIDDCEGRLRVESRSGLVQEDDLRFGDEFDSDGDSLPLSSRNPSDELIPHIRLRRVRDIEHAEQHVLHGFLELFPCETRETTARTWRLG